MKHFDELTSFIAEGVENMISAHEMEQGLWKQMLSFGHQSLQVFFNQCGSGDKGETITLDNGRTLKRLNHLHPRPYLTVFGEFSLERCVYGSREGQKIEHIPLDVRLQLPERKFSYLLQDWNQSMSSELPFGKVSHNFFRLPGFRQSVDSLEQSGRQLSEAVDDFWKQSTLPDAEKEGGLMVATADGKGVVMRSGELEAGVQQEAKKPERPGNKKMALIGAVYTVDPFPRTPEQLLAALFSDLRSTGDPAPPNRPKPMYKQVRGALLRNEQGKTDPQSETIFNWLAEAVKQRG